MLFDLGLGKGAFEREFIYSMVGGGGKPPVMSALEWQAEDQRMIKALQTDKLRQYYVVGAGYDNYFQESFGMLSPFDTIPTQFSEWRPSSDTKVKIATASVDVAVCSEHATEILGMEGLHEALQETARILRPDGHLMLFYSDDTLLPDNMEKYFTLGEERRGGDEAEGLVALKLLPKPQAPPPRLRRRRRRVVE